MINGLTVNPEVKVGFINTFVVSIKYMFGDADNYSVKTYPLSEAETILVKNLYDHGKWTKDHGYTRHELYGELAQTMDEDDMCDFFPADHDAWGYGKFDDIEFTYYDDKGLPHAVDFWWK